MIQQKPTRVKEGKTTVFVYLQNTKNKGPGAKTGFPFYNPTMEINRDSSLLIAQWLIDYLKKPIRFLDGLAASGIRGIRFANELHGDFTVYVNEWNDAAFSLIQKNIKENHLENIISIKDNLHRLLADQHFEYIDIDPFGSPMEFIDGAMRCIVHQGVIACTATDTAALCGVYPKVCLRRYGAWPLHGYLMREIGIRILLGVLCREAAKYDKGIRPLWCYSTDHFFRLYVQIYNGKRYVNDSMSKYSIFSSKDIPLSNLFPQQQVGPLWYSHLHSNNVLEHMEKTLLHMKLGTHSHQISSLNVCLEEVGLPAFFYSTEAAAHLYKMSPPKVNNMINGLRELGYKASRCSLSTYGFRTNAPQSTVEKMFHV
jgi:tRNA (guanine26-N2/guanine27-N2)-dimethyltransferase